MLSLTFHTHVHNRGAGTRGKKCSTGQRRPNYKTKQKRKEKYYNNINYQRRRERDTKEPDYQKKS
jgi:hypothetical protein